MNTIEEPIQPQLKLIAKVGFYITKHAKELLVLFCAVLVPLLIFGKLAREVSVQETFSFDESILYFIYSYESPSLNLGALLLSKLGYEWGVLPFDIGLFLYFVYQRNRNRAIFWALGVGGAALLNQVAKTFFERPRPELWLSLAPEHNFSFPSGHAMGATAMAVSLSILFWHTRYRWIVIGCGGVFAGLVCLSRLYLGVHYPSDVIAGILAALAWVMGVRFVTRALKLPLAH